MTYNYLKHEEIQTIFQHRLFDFGRYSPNEDVVKYLLKTSTYIDNELIHRTVLGEPKRYFEIHTIVIFNYNLLPSDTEPYVCVSGGKKYWLLGKFYERTK